MNMRKRILSLIMAAFMLPSVSVAFAESPTIIVDECFDNYPTNETTLALESESGIDGRVIDEDGDKVYYIRAWEENAEITIPVNSAEKKLVVSADIKISGERTSGELFVAADSMGNTTPLLTINKRGSVSLPDGKEICGCNMDKWMEFDIILNTSSNKITVIKDGKKLVEEWIAKSMKITYISNMKFTLEAPGENKESDLYIDDLRIYVSDEVMEDSAFARKPYNDKVLDFTETASMEVMGDYVFADYNLNGGINVLTPFWTAKVDHAKEDNGNGYALFTRTGEIDNDYADIFLTDEQIKIIGKTRGFVMEIDVMPIKFEGTGAAFLAQRSITGTWLAGPEISQDIGFCGKKLPVGKWSTLGMVYNYKDKLLDTYLNGELLSSVPLTTKRQKTGLFRIDIPGTGGEVIFGVDNIKIYEGLEPKESEPSSDIAKVESPVATFNSVMEKDSDAQKLIGDSLVLMLTNDKVYYDGTKEQLADAPYVTNGRTMVPVRFISEKFNCNVDWNPDTRQVTINDNCVMAIGDNNISVNGSNITSDVAPEIKNGRTYLPLRVLCEEVLGKKVHYDERDMVIVSDEIYPYKDSDNIAVVTDPIDTVFRYMQYDRPKGEDIINLIKQNNPDNAHPRLSATPELVAELRSKVADDEHCAEWARLIIDRAEADYNNPVLQYEKRDGLRLLPISWACQERIERWTMAYWITGDKRYADRAWLDIESCSNFPDWNDKAHFLDTAELCNAFALAYDAFYDIYTDEQKKIMRDAIYTKAFIPALDAYQGVHPNGYWVTGNDNWTAVCPGGLLIAALAIADEGDYQDVISVIIEQTLQSFEYVMGLFYPDGAWYESAAYLCYTLHHVAHGLGSLYNSCGTDYNFFNVKGFDGVGNFINYIQGPAEGGFNYHDGSTGYQEEDTFYWYARAMNSPGFMSARKNMATLFNQDKPDLFPYGLLWYNPKWSGASSEIPLDIYYYSAETGTMRHSWDGKNDEYVGVHAGRNHIDHDNLDLGSFIYESEGVRWAYDVGADNYNLPGYFTMQGYNLYVKRPEGNNCLLINPREGYLGQYLDAYAPLTKFEGNDDGAIAVFDLSDAYRDDASSVTRGFYFGEDRRTLTIRDEIKGAPANSDIYFIMHTPATAIQIDGNTAILSKDGKQCRVEVASNADSIEILNMDAKPFPTSPVVEGQRDLSEFRRLSIKFKAGGDVDIAVKLIPVKEGVNADKVNLTPISDWVLAE